MASPLSLRQEPSASPVEVQGGAGSGGAGRDCRLLRGAGRAGSHVARDAFGITSDAVNHRRRERVQEVQPDEVQARVARDDATLVYWIAVGRKDRKVVPRESGMEASAPDHVLDVEHPA